MKRFLALILVVLLIGSLFAGCSDQGVGVFIPSQSAGATQAASQTRPEATVPSWMESVESEPVETQSDNALLTALDFTPDPNTFSDYRVTLTRVANFQNEDISGVSRYMPVIRTTENGKNVDRLLSFDGQDKLGKSVDNYDYFGDGITAIYSYDNTKPNCELVNINTGKVYISDGAVKVEKLDERFYYVIYVTELTENKNECFFYVTNQLFSMSPAEGDQMYKGYAVVYDLQKEAFVDGVRVEKPGEEIEICEQTLCLKHSYDSYSFYSAEGTQLAEKIEDVSLGGKYIFRELYEGCEIYDSSFNLLGFIEGAAPIQGSGLRYDDRYLKYGKYQDFGVMKITGEKVTGQDYYQILDVWGDYIVCRNADETITVLFGDGTTAVEGGTYKQAIVPSEGLPALRLCDMDDRNYLYLPGGQILPLNKGTSSEMVYKIMNEEDYSYDYLIYGTGQWVHYEDSKILCKGLLETEAGIVEVFTGSVMLPGQVDFAAATDEYLYICNDDVWTTYSVTLSD